LHRKIVAIAFALASIVANVILSNEVAELFYARRHVVCSGTLALCRTDLSVAETTRQVVVHHAYGLHEGIADGGADEGESPFF
jgi:hypothetical protein